MIRFFFSYTQYVRKARSCVRAGSPCRYAAAPTNGGPPHSRRTADCTSRRGSCGECDPPHHPDKRAAPYLVRLLLRVWPHPRCMPHRPHCLAKRLRLLYPARAQSAIVPAVPPRLEARESDALASAQQDAAARTRTQRPHAARRRAQRRATGRVVSAPAYSHCFRACNTEPRTLYRSRGVASSSPLVMIRYDTDSSFRRASNDVSRTRPWPRGWGWAC